MWPCVCRVTTKFWVKANCPSSPWSSRPSSSADGPRRRSRLLEEPACWWHRAPLTLFLQNKSCKWGILVCFQCLHMKPVLLWVLSQNRLWVGCYCKFIGDFQILEPLLYTSKCWMHKSLAEEISEQKMYFLTFKLTFWTNESATLQ